MEIEILVFKESGKWYASQTVKNDIDINHTPSLQEDIEKFAHEVADKQGEYLEKHILPFLENNYPDNFNDIKQLFEKHKMIERKYIRDFFMKKYNHIVTNKFPNRNND